MLKIGLTGGIGSGKSTVARIFETLGIPVFYADKETKRLMNESPELKEKLIEHFGPGSYDDQGLNRTYIASIVFNDVEKLELLNSLTHPITIQYADKWMSQQTSPYIIKEAALIFESGSHKQLDKVIGIYAPSGLRIERVMKRDKVTKGEVLKRLDRQMNEEEKMKLCDFVIQNDEQQLLIPQVLKLHKELLEASKRF